MAERRRLRSGGACQPLENIFRNEHYRSILPPHIYAKITNTPSINCDKIRDLKIEQLADHPSNLKLMKQAVLEFSDVRSSNNDRLFESE